MNKRIIPKGAVCNGKRENELEIIMLYIYPVIIIFQKVIQNHTVSI